MQKDGSGWLCAPCVGQRFTDDAGKHWQVRAVIHSPGAGGYYIVRVSFGSNPECADGVSLLGRGEFSALFRDMNLRAVTPTDAPQPGLTGSPPARPPAEMLP